MTAKLSNELNYYPYWVEKQKQHFLIVAENITDADKLLKENYNTNPQHSVVKNLKFVFSDLRNNRVIHIRGLDKNGDVVKSKYPSLDSFEIHSRGGKYTTVNIQTTADLIKLKNYLYYFDKVTVFAGDIPLTWAFTVEDAIKKFSDIYSKGEVG